MATKFKMRSSAQATLLEQQQERQVLIERLLVLHNNNWEQVQACMEGVVEILNTMVGRMNAGKNPLEQVQDPKQQRILMGILAGAKALMDYPEAAEGHNLTPNRLRQVISLAGTNTDATKMLLQVAKSAPTVVTDITSMFHQFNQALEKGDQAKANSVKQEIQRLWYFWQRNVPKQPLTKM
jgi:hypothetical protein